MDIEFLANTTALLLSFVSVVILGNASFQMDKSAGNGLRVITLGVFLSVFCHAAAELMSLMKIMDEYSLFLIMSTLLGIGALLFSVGGLIIISDNNNSDD